MLHTQAEIILSPKTGSVLVCDLFIDFWFLCWSVTSLHVAFIYICVLPCNYDLYTYMYVNRDTSTTVDKRVVFNVSNLPLNVPYAGVKVVDIKFNSASENKLNYNGFTHHNHKRFFNRQCVHAIIRRTMWHYVTRYLGTLVNMKDGWGTSDMVHCRTRKDISVHVYNS